MSLYIVSIVKRPFATSKIERSPDQKNDGCLFDGDLMESIFTTWRGDVDVSRSDPYLVEDILVWGILMFCPNCRTEYVEGFTVCSDCEIPLVSELPAEPSPKLPEDVEFEEVSSILTGDSIATVRSLLENEYIDSLPLTVLESDELSTLSSQLRSKFPSSVTTMTCDLADLESQKNLIHWIKSNEHIDILINNAGLGYFGRFEDLGWNQIEKTIALNISALIHLTYGLIPILKKRPIAKIVNISSGMARLPYPGLAVYGATKGFVSTFSESLSSELSGTSISVLCFHPGFAMTSFISSAGMNMQKVPRILIHSPEDIAIQIVRALRKDKQWAYSDIVTRLSAELGTISPSRLKTSILKDLFWRLPDAK